MQGFKNILYVAETSVPQGPAIARALSLAENNQADLTVMDVVPIVTAGIAMPSGGPTPVQLQTAMVSARRHELESLFASGTAPSPRDIEVRVGNKTLEVIRTVLRNHCDLLIKAAEDPGWIGRLFGSDDMHLLRQCPCPVWLMKPQEKANYDRIVAAVDFNPNDPSSDPDERTLNRQILALAGALAFSDFAELHLVHVWDAPEAALVRLWVNDPDAAEMNMIEGERLRHTKGMEILMRMLREEIGAEAHDYLSPRVHLPRGSPRELIPALVNELKADLVVMGTVARSGIPGFIIGNTAEAIFDQLQCAVLAIKPAGFVSPVTLA
jgi:nucleotide-binding universal stress UspA family protein